MLWCGKGPVSLLLLKSSCERKWNSAVTVNKWSCLHLREGCKFVGWTPYRC